MKKVRFMPLLNIDRRRLLIGGLAIFAIGLFVAFAAAAGNPGYPLDDAWIHQTYARNLARSGRWEYVPGQISAGSTAPLWTLLLTLGYLLRLHYLWWSYFLGFLALIWLAFTGMRLWRALWPEQADKDWLPGIVLVLSWPLVWAAVSGMETLLFIALGLSIVALCCEWKCDGPAESLKTEAVMVAVPGFLCGLLILVRPDGLILLLLVGAALALQRPEWRQWWLPALFLAAAVLPLLPYFIFNFWSSGHLWPNTFYAKQAEYAALLARPIAQRFGQLLYFSLGGPETGLRGISGAHLLLLPGLLVAGWHAIRNDWRRRRLRQTLPLLWACGHILLYAWRLPVTYQHGRYLWAALPIWMIYGLAGWQWLFAGLKSSSLRRPAPTLSSRVSRQVAGLTFSALLALFLLLGAQVYATNVSFIEGEMVDVAHWLQANTPQDALIASHDIGAIGYFAERPLLDLAGLISPEVIDLLADEMALAGYIQRSQAAYLVTAPGWPYTTLTNTAGVTQLYSTGHQWTREQGYNNMAVYHLP